MIRYVFATLLLTWLFWQIPFASIASVGLPEVTKKIALKGDLSASGAPAAFFYRKTGVGQYLAYGLTETGQVARVLQLPGASVKKADESTIRLEGKEGYITGSQNGTFFIWYPQLGSQIYLFNESGTFLWEKEESHYLHSLPRGRFILAAAGDQSRVLFMNPDFKVQADFQGMLFNGFIADDRTELLRGQVCLSSLNGEVVVAQLDKKVYVRQNLGYALKSIACNFETGDMAAIVERAVVKDGVSSQKDFLERYMFDLSKEKANSEAQSAAKSTLKLLSSVQIPLRTTTQSIMAVTPDTICFVGRAPQANTEGANQRAFYFTKGRTGDLASVLLSQSADGAPVNVDQWKAAVLRLGSEEACLLVHPSQQLLVGNERGLLLHRTDLGGERVLQTQNKTFVQNGASVFLLE